MWVVVGTVCYAAVAATATAPATAPAAVVVFALSSGSKIGVDFVD